MRLAFMVLHVLVGVGGSSSLNGQVPSLVADRVARIGAVDGPGALSQAFSLEILPDGRLLIAEPQFPGIVVYGPDGEFHKVIGRRGQGPGEYSIVGRLGWVSDTLYAIDHGRLHFYSADLEHLATRRVAAQYPRSSDILFIFPGPPTPDGHIIGVAMPSPSAEKRSDVRLPIPLLDRSGEHVAVVGTVQVANRSVRIPLGDGEPPSSVPNPWRDDDLWTLSIDGSTVIIATRQQPGGVSAATYSLVALTSRGDTVLERSYTYAPQELTQGDYETTIRSLAARLSSTSELAPARIEALLKDAIPRPRTYPPVSELVAGRDGTIWLRREASRSTVKWEILARDGTVIGFTTLPADLRVLQAEHGRVWGVRRDEMDIPFIEVWDVV